MPFEIIRDPLWNNIRVDPLALRLVDSRPFQRLRYVRQLGLAYLVYPGASHSRFEHALGAYHLARRALALFEERELASRPDAEESRIVRCAALLHDIGHYPFSHALEEIGALHHEEVARPLITGGEVAEVLREALGADAPERIMALIRGTSTSPLQGLISGSLDLDKIEYLKRDAFMCGVNYGDIDVDRLLDSLTIVTDPERGRHVVGISEKGLSALESLLFAKYQMYRNVYWHHAVRSATAMYKRLVDGALRAGSLGAETLAAFTDEGLLHELAQRAPTPLLAALRERRLYKRVFECPAAELPPGGGEWIADDRALVVAVEDRLAAELGLGAGELLLDYPTKTQMLGLDIPVVRRDGTVRRLTAAGWEGAVNLPKLSEELYGSARWLRVFACRRVSIEKRAVVRLAEMSGDEVRTALQAGALLERR
ncbi:MAG: metal-dependent phosphohydrolase sub protein [Gemmatimonadetes bacterium]|jgi:HD superfamily phosphohydrolase|nr:metal-dependent phosphohydrolase sub protein [Gemmatimonadota bacterium]